MFTLWWFIRRLLGRLQPFEQEIVAHGFGWWSPAMRPHWRRLFRFSPADFVHAAVNIRVEWTRLDPQRAAKMSMDAELVLCTVAAWVVLW